MPDTRVAGAEHGKYPDATICAALATLQLPDSIESELSTGTCDPRRPALEMPYFRQVEVWDCGITCLQMVLASIDPGPGNFDCHKQAIYKYLGGLQSTWTIDLAVLLLQFQTKFAAEDYEQRQAAPPQGQVQLNASAKTQAQVLRQPGAGANATAADAVADAATSSSRRRGISFVFCTASPGVEESYSDCDFYKSALDQDSLRVKALFESARPRSPPLPPPPPAAATAPAAAAAAASASPAVLKLRLTGRELRALLRTRQVRDPSR
jgi:hypothetical protein